MRRPLENVFEEALEAFPAEARQLLRRIPQSTGRLSAGAVHTICAAMAVTPRELALDLLPLARAFARPEISGFRVGAVAVVASSTGETALFLGANMEFPGLPLHHTIHAEQAAVVNAWWGEARQLTAMAVSAPPCGACRQFLLEAAGDGTLEILLPATAGDVASRTECHPIQLGTLLPEAFGPEQLDAGSGLFCGRPKWRDLPGGNTASEQRADPPADPVSRAALEAAVRSYAPYTENLAGCALGLTGGEVVTGATLENAAYNPGLTAIQAALARANFTVARLPEDIERVVLAERATSASQAAGTKLFLSAWAPRADHTIHRF